MPDTCTATPRLVIDLIALIRNLGVLRSATSALVAPVVKANAYGLGQSRIAEAFSAAGCRTFFTGSTSEGIALREVLPDAEIFVLTPAPQCDAALLLNHRLKPCLYSPEQIQQYVASAKTLGREPSAALHFETGINRLGLDPADLPSIRSDSATRPLQVDLVMSHLACADDPDSTVINRRQLEKFRSLRVAFPGVRASLANSGGVFLGADFHFDIVRPGIALYGCDPHFATQQRRVEPVATLEALLAQVKTVEAGECVGYGATVVAEQAKRIGVLLAGYADGFNRRLATVSKDGPQTVAIGPRRAPLFGRISMDLATVDLSGLSAPEPATGDWVELFGCEIRIEELAERCGTIPYEILTGVATRVDRVYRN